MRRLLTVALTVASAAGPVTTSGCADDAGSRGATDMMVLETCAPDRRPLEVEICRCALASVKEQYSPAALERLDRRLRDDPDRVPADIQRAVLECTFAAVAPSEPRNSSTPQGTAGPGR